ncbi:MAG: S-layer homology domain-containing protein [Oscillospiraceae bacterium]|nr:S-layer homology domain-containing protein [Oscillospiraceae bacterium]
MKMSKKLIALVVIVAMIATMGMTAFASFSDVPAGTVTYEAVNTLSALGILEGFPDGSFQPDGDITRAQFAAVVTRAMGFSGIMTQGSTRFTDVPATHWASGYVRMATDLGVINGFPDGTFGPDANVTYEQAVTMIMRAIGFEPMAQQRGGFPTGYLVAAAQMNVTANIGVVNQTEPAPRGLVARLVYAAIDTPLMERFSWGNEAQYVIMDGTGGNPRRTLLSDAHNVTKLRGVVTANRFTTLTGLEVINNQSIQEETVRMTITDNFMTNNQRYFLPTGYPFVLTNVAFRVGTSNAANLIGQRVIVYVRNEAGLTQDDVVISIVPEAGRNVSTEFSIADLDRFDAPNTGAHSLRYFRDGGSRNATTLTLAMDGNDPAYAVLFNGRWVDAEELFTSGTSMILGDQLANGTITVVDTNGTGTNDLVIVNSAAVFVVDEVDLRSRALIARNPVNSRRVPSVIELDVDNLDVAYRITANGRTIRLEDIEEGDVLSVEVNMVEVVDDFLFNIRVASSTVEGRVDISSTSARSWNPSEATDAQGNLLPGATYWVDGTEYYVAVGAYNTEGIRVGSEGIFTLDENGNIAAFEGRTGRANYGFVTAVNAGDDGFSRRGVIQIVERDGSVANRQLATVINIENSQFGAGNDSFRGDGGTNGNFAPLPMVPGGSTGTGLDYFVGKLIRFDLNASYQIASVEFARTNANSDREFSSVGAAYTDREFEFDARNNRFSTIDGTPRLNANIDNETLVFFIAGGGTNANPFNADRSEVRRANTIADGEVFERMQLFDLNDRSGAISVAVAIDHSFIPRTGSVAVFDSVSQTINNVGERVRSVRFFIDGRETTANTTMDTVHYFDNMDRGTAFRYNVNTRNEIDSVAVLFGLNNVSVDNTPPTTLRLPTLVDLADNFYVETGTLVNEVSVWIDDANRSQTRIIMGPVVQTGTGFVTVGPRATDAAPELEGDTQASRWNAASMRYNIRSDANIYVLDMSQRTSNRQLVLGNLGQITRPHQQWLTAGARLRTTALDANPDFPAPAIAVRDWVVILEQDNVVTDVIILKAFPYQLRL